MYNIAITGSFAVGKSFVLQCLSSMGYKVFSCDEYVKNLYEDKQIQKIVEQEIKGLVKFNKIQLANIIYKDSNQRAKLEKIIHPKVRFAVSEFEKQNQNEDFIFTEVPLLFETGFDKNFPYIVCIYCSEKTREYRGKSARGVSAEIFEKIKHIQLPQEEKKSRADFIIDGELVEEKIKTELIEIINRIK